MFLFMNWVMLEVVYSLWLKKIKYKGLRGEWGWYIIMDCLSKDRWGGKILLKGVKIYFKGLGKGYFFVMRLMNKIMLYVVNKECIEVKKKI